MKGRGERKKKEGRKARKRVPSPSRCCSLRPPLDGGASPFLRSVHLSQLARMHAKYFTTEKKRGRERGTVSLRTHNAHARTQSLPAVGDLNVPHVRPFSSIRRLPPVVPRKEKKQQQPQQKRRPSGEAARRGSPRRRCRRRRHLVLLLRRPRRAVCQSLSFVATL